MNKIYNADELQEIIIDLFYKELLTGVYKIKEDRDELRKGITTRIQEYKELLKTKTEPSERYILHEACNTLENMLEETEEPTIEKQKELYNRTGDVSSSHTTCTIDLKDKINPVYDTCKATIVFFDSLTNTEGLKELEQQEDKISYIKSKVEITHILITYKNIKSKVEITHIGINYKNYTIVLYGKYDKDNPSVLPREYVDFTLLDK